MKYICSKCGHEEDIQTLKPKCDCGGLWKLDFQPPKFSRDLIDTNTWSIFRYRKFMALPDESWRQVTLGEGIGHDSRGNDSCRSGKAVPQGYLCGTYNRGCICRLFTLLRGTWAYP